MKDSAIQWCDETAAASSDAFGPTDSAPPGAGATPSASLAGSVSLPRMCSRCRRAPPRHSDQRYCPRCHAAVSQAYRLRYARELTRLKQLWVELKRDDRSTRRHFTKRFGTARRVLVSRSIGGNALPDCSCEVLRFRAGNSLELRDVKTGEVFCAALHEVKRDRSHQWIE
jgi:hypothetical protein